MPKDEERKELTQEEIDARDEKFRTFFTTSVAQVPEEMTRRDDGAAEKPNEPVRSAVPPRKNASRRPTAQRKRAAPARSGWAVRSRRTPPSWSWS